MCQISQKPTGGGAWGIANFESENLWIRNIDPKTTPGFDTVTIYRESCVPGALLFLSSESERLQTSPEAARPFCWARAFEFSEKKTLKSYYYFCGGCNDRSSFASFIRIRMYVPGSLIIVYRIRTVCMHCIIQCTIYNI